MKNLRNSHQEAENFIEKQPLNIEILDYNCWCVGSFDASDSMMDVCCTEA